jgi:carbonyl reductase 1
MIELIFFKPNVTNNLLSGESLRKKFCSPNLTDEELVDLVQTYLNDVRNGVHIANGWPTTAYGMSKIALNALTFIQQKQFNEDKTRQDIIVNAVHPGYVNTDMTNHKGPLTIEQGADAPKYLALLPNHCSEPVGAMVWCDRTIVNWDRV